jgi:hypothetical protein
LTTSASLLPSFSSRAVVARSARASATASWRAAGVNPGSGLLVAGFANGTLVPDAWAVAPAGLKPAREPSTRAETAAPVIV